MSEQKIKADNRTVTQSYSVARDEIILRMKLRDQILLTFLVVIATLLGIAFKERGSYEILLAIPFLSLGAMSLITSHVIVADHLGDFCAKELGGFIYPVPQWDKSKSLRDYTHGSSKYRSIAHGLIIIMPCVIGLGVNYKYLVNYTFPFCPIWWLGLLSCVVTAIIMILGIIARRDKYKQRQWEEGQINSKKNIVSCSRGPQATHGS